MMCYLCPDTTCYRCPDSVQPWVCGTGAGRCRRHARWTRPNVLFVFYDQYRSDVIGAYGGGDNISTPHIDRLAEDGVLFANGLSTTPVCTPYRGMLMTGRYPTHTGLMLNFLEANTTVRGIADAFRNEGYRTAFMGKWHGRGEPQDGVGRTGRRQLGTCPAVHRGQPRLRFRPARTATARLRGLGRVQLSRRLPGRPGLRQRAPGRIAAASRTETLHTPLDHLPTGRSGAA